MRQSDFVAKKYHFKRSYCGEQNTRELNLLFGGGCTIFVCVGFCKQRESHTYDPVYDLRSKNTTKNTLNATFFGKGAQVVCIISSIKV